MCIAPINAADNYSIAYGELVVPLVKAVQEQQAIIEQQNKKNDQLQQQVDTLIKRNTINKREIKINILKSAATLQDNIIEVQ